MSIRVSFLVLCFCFVFNSDGFPKKVSRDLIDYGNWRCCSYGSCSVSCAGPFADDGSSAQELWIKSCRELEGKHEDVKEYLANCQLKTIIL